MSNNNGSRDIEKQRYRYMAKVAEQAERYDEMVEYMRARAMMGDELDVEERNLLSVGYKNVIGARRASWRIVSTLEQNEEQAGCTTEKYQNIKAYREKIEKELSKICGEVLDLINDHLLPQSKNEENEVFYNKMKGDYNRYLAEFKKGEEKDLSSIQAEEAYKKATEIADLRMSPTHPIRLGLALNYSVFYYEIKNSACHACEKAKAAFDSAVEALTKSSMGCNTDTYKDSTLIMQLLRDNLALWTADSQHEESSTSTNTDCCTSQDQSNEQLS